jgi:hypothetical protein
MLAAHAQRGDCLMAQDTHQRALERYEDAKEALSEQHLRMLEDLKFSNPADPQQWDDDARRTRKGRVILTLDRTNQYITQVVNDARQNKPGISTMPADSGADVEVAKRLDGIIRHIEYRSRAPIAYDTGIEHAARCGLGWFRVVPEVVRAETNHQEACIKRVHDPLSICIDPDSTEPDGSDAMFGFAETMLSERAFKAQFPKAETTSWQGGDGYWQSQDAIRVCEYQYVEETEANHIVVEAPDGGQIDLSEDDYWTLAKQIGYSPRVVSTFMAKKRTVKWCKLNGSEVLEETEFPSRWIGFIPVIGYELWIEGKRYLCGLTRRMMEAQRAYNYERSALVEAVAMQPKAPAMVAIEAITGHEKHWNALNSGTPAYLPYNAVNDEGAAIPAPSRLAPPAFPAAFAQGGQIALGDLEASVGMTQSNLGNPNNATSGRQERERKEQGATATYHFVDNLSRSIEHAGRILVDMIPRLYDVKRQARILGLDGTNDAIEVDPQMGQAVKRERGKVVAINPGVGTYDVRIQAGSNYVTQRQDAAEGITEILQAAPQFAPVLAPSLVKLKDWPDADKVARMLLAMAPPEVQAIANEGQDGEQPIPQQVRAQLQQMQQQMQEMGQMLDAGEKELERLQGENEQLKADKQIEMGKLALQAEEGESQEAIDAYRAQTERIKALSGFDQRM